MQARRRGMPRVLGLVVLILVALATQVPRVCHDATDSTAALSDVAVVSVAAPQVSDPCGDATAALNATAVCRTRLDVTDPTPIRPTVMSIPRGGPPANGAVTTGTPVPAAARPPLGLAVANLAVTRI